MFLLACELSFEMYVCDHQAEIDAQESVRGMLSVMDSLTEEHNGAFLNYKGQTIPW